MGRGWARVTQGLRKGWARGGVGQGIDRGWEIVGPGSRRAWAGGLSLKLQGPL